MEGGEEGRAVSGGQWPIKAGIMHQYSTRIALRCSAAPVPALRTLVLERDSWSCLVSFPPRLSCTLCANFPILSHSCSNCLCCRVAREAFRLARWGRRLLRIRAYAHQASKTKACSHTPVTTPPSVLYNTTTSTTIKHAHYEHLWRDPQLYTLTLALSAQHPTCSSRHTPF